MHRETFPYLNILFSLPTYALSRDSSLAERTANDKTADYTKITSYSLQRENSLVK